jgi:hypothetical protein
MDSLSSLERHIFFLPFVVSQNIIFPDSDFTERLVLTGDVEVLSNRKRKRRTTERRT